MQTYSVMWGCARAYIHYGLYALQEQVWDFLMVLFRHAHINIAALPIVYMCLSVFGSLHDTTDCFIMYKCVQTRSYNDITIMEILIFNEQGRLSRSYTQTIKGEVFVYPPTSYMFVKVPELSHAVLCPSLGFSAYLLHIQGNLACNNGSY